MDSEFYYYVRDVLEIPNSGGSKVFFLLRHDAKDNFVPVKIIEKNREAAFAVLDMVREITVIDYKKDYSNAKV